MKKTQYAPIYPFNRGLDLSSIPGTQNIQSLTRAKNISLSSRNSIRKRPGLSRISHIAAGDGVQAAIQFIATSGNSQRSEIIRARKGRLEALREAGPGEPAFVDLGVSFSDTDKVTFERFQNALVIHFENSPTLYYNIGGTPEELSILSSHTTSPPGFSREHDFRLWYSGRPADPHVMWVSAIGNFEDYTLNGGGFKITVKYGDGDPVGITGISPTFRDRLYAFKWNHVYEITRTAYGYGVNTITDESGAVCHTAIKRTQNEIYSVAYDGIHALSLTDRYGGVESTTLTFPLYEYFQETINWAAAKWMTLEYDPATANLLLSCAVRGSSTPNHIFSLNTITREMTEWEDCEYPAMFKYFDYGNRRFTAVADETHGICLLDNKVNTLNGDPIEIDFETGQIFPMGNPKLVVTLTRGWLVCRPTSTSVDITVSYTINGEEPVDTVVNTLSEGYGALIAETEQGIGGGVIGTDIIGKVKSDMILLEFDCKGEASSVAFRIKQSPTDEDPDQSCEIFGIIYEFDYNEDKTSTTII